MNTLLTARSSAHKPVRAAVIAASLAVLACFGAAIGTLESPAQAAETQAQVAAD